MKRTKKHQLIVLMISLCCIGSSTKITTYKGIFDRVEGDHAVILLESLRKTIVVPTYELPSGSHMDTWFDIECVNETCQVIAIDSELTKEQAKKSTHLLEKLRNIQGGL